MLAIITRQEAIKAGIKHYFDGNPCIKNHISRRRVSNKHCLMCCNEWQKNAMKNNKKYKESQQKNSSKAAKRRRLCRSPEQRENDRKKERSLSLKHREKQRNSQNKTAHKA